MTHPYVPSRRAARPLPPARVPRSRTVATVIAAGLTLLVGGCATPAEQAAVRGSGAGDARLSSATPPQPQIAPEPSGRETPVGGQPWDGSATAACDGALPAGYAEVAQAGDGAGVTSFWTRGQGWVACDVALAPDGASPTLIDSGRGGRRGFDERSLTLSTSQPLPTGGTAVRFVAGGRLPWPVEEISYTFPDGHTEKARFVASAGSPEETWWVVAYTVTDGPLLDPETEAAQLGPVTISILGGAAEAFRLPWVEAQRNE